jgi:hypothetical protein
VEVIWKWDQTYQDVLILEWRHLAQFAIRINVSFFASRSALGFTTSTHCGLA